MRNPVEIGHAGAGNAAPRGLLVLGYQGILTADPEHRAGSDACPEKLPAAELPLEPWSRDAQGDLRRRLFAGPQECGGECIDIGALAEPLRERLAGILTQVLAVHPDTSEETLGRTYPLLAALLNSAVDEWVDAIATFHTRFHRDAARLAEWMGLAELPELVSLTPARSDTHAGGHMVMRLLFQGGRCIYYKPRPVTGEWLWDRLVQAVNAHSGLELDSAAALVGRNERYGWVASLTPRQGLAAWDQSSADAGAWWHAAGATLCLAAHVRMTDLHLANVMATCRGPAPVDAESFGSPRPADEALTAGAQGQAISAALANLLDTGLLPNVGPGELPDVSGLFGKAAAVPGILVPSWSREPSGAHTVRMVPSALLDQGNAPSGFSPLQVMPLLVSGYREAANALMRCRDGVLLSGSAWRQMLEHLHAPRIILRDTLVYGLLLSESLQPERLQSEQRRRIALRNSLRACGGGAFPHAVARVELRNLLNLHFPRFTALPNSRSLAGSSGRPLARRFLACSPQEAVLRGIAELSNKRLDEVLIPALLLALLGQRGRS